MACSASPRGRITQWLSCVVLLTVVYIAAGPDNLMTSSLDFVWIVVAELLDMPWRPILWGESDAGLKFIGVVAAALLFTWPLAFRPSAKITLLASVFVLLPFLPCKPLGQISCGGEGHFFGIFFASLFILWTLYWFRGRLDKIPQPAVYAGNISRTVSNVLYGGIIAVLFFALSFVGIFVGFPVALVWS